MIYLVKTMRLTIPMLFLALTAGCTTAQNTLGETTTLFPGWSRLKQVTAAAIRDPNVWAPLAVGAGLQVGDLDKEISESLREEQPLFGSVENAKDVSDNFRNLTTISYVSTALLATGPDEAGSWLFAKTKLLGSEWLTVQAGTEIYGEIKISTERERPDGSNNLSFPSGHATRATLQAQLSVININYLPVDSIWKQRLNWTVTGFAGVTAYARVEAGRHYPSDVLAGWALGSFIGHIAKAFIIPNEQNMMIMPQITDDISRIQFSIDL